ncbi:hypothetical protein GW17_00034024 [Ensete ventricosum]|nr:hypothetical protein GW17_00034024 [Ensete ventricosum]
MAWGWRRLVSCSAHASGCAKHRATTTCPPGMKRRCLPAPFGPGEGLLVGKHPSWTRGSSQGPFARASKGIGLLEGDLKPSARVPSSSRSSRDMVDLCHRTRHQAIPIETQNYCSLGDTIRSCRNDFSSYTRDAHEVKDYSYHLGTALYLSYRAPVGVPC